jgi:hypothetical protein
MTTAPPPDIYINFTGDLTVALEEALPLTCDAEEHVTFSAHLNFAFETVFVFQHLIHLLLSLIARRWR